MSAQARGLGRWLGRGLARGLARVWGHDAGSGGGLLAHALWLSLTLARSGVLCAHPPAHTPSQATGEAAGEAAGEATGEATALPHPPSESSAEPRAHPLPEASVALEPPTLIVRHARRGEALGVEGRHARLDEVLMEGGAWVQRSGGPASATQVSLRGASGQQSALYLEGVPLHSARSQALDLSLLPLSLLSEVSVEGGGDGARDGSGAQGGRVALSLPSLPMGDRAAARLGVTTQRGAELGLSVGRGGARGGAEVTLAAGGGDGAFAYTDRAGLLRRRAGAGYERLAGALTWEARGDLGSLSGVASVGRLARGEPGPDGLELGGAGSAQRLSLASLTLTPSPAPTPTLAPTLTLYASERSYVYEEASPLWQGAGRARFAFEDLSAGASLSWGLTPTLALPPLSWGLTLSGALTRAQTGEAEGSALSGGGERAVAALAPTLALTAGAWRLEGALRLDLNTERAPLLVPSLTARWRTGERARLSCHGRASRAFRDPGLDERYLRGPGLLPNPSLRPEDGLWGELGCALSAPNRRWRVEASGFSQRYSRLILYVPLDVYRTQARDDFGASVWGAELSASARLTRAPLPPTRLEGRLSELRHEQRATDVAGGASEGRPLPLRPTRFGWARLSADLSPVSLWVKGWGRGPLSLDRYALRALPGALFVDVGARRAWEVGAWRLSLDVSFQNLLGERAQDALLRPLPGRSVWVSVDVSVGGR